MRVYYPVDRGSSEEGPLFWTASMVLHVVFLATGVVCWLQGLPASLRKRHHPLRLVRDPGHEDNCRGTLPYSPV